MLLAVAVFSWAAPVDKTKAAKAAKAFAADKLKMPDAQMTLAWTSRSGETADGNPSVYAYNISQGKGFVVVADIDGADTVLGYSDEGGFDGANMPPAMMEWLEQYSCEITQNSGNASSQGSLTPRRAKEYPKNAIQPLLNTQWNQLEPYNSSCPDFYTGEKCVTGCVAAGMSQILYYHHKESTSKTLAQIPAYTCTTNWSTGRISVAAVAAGTKLDWDNMLFSYNGSETQAQIDAVANLLLYCAASVKTEFKNGNNGGSPASSADVPTSLKKYFGYSDACCYKKRSAYSISQWESMIYNQLEKGWPVMYSGQSATSAHLFIVDGYDGEDFYHINWGWGGRANGYFKLSVASVVESSSTAGYSIDQAAIFNAHPALTTDVADPLAAYGFSLSGTKVSFKVANYTGNANSFKVGLAAVLADGSLKVVKQASAFSSINILSTKSMSFTIAASDLSSLAKGTYVLKPVVCTKTDSSWRLCESSDQYGLTLTWNGSTPSIAFKSPTAGRSFTASGFSYPSGAAAGTTVPVSMTVKCAGGEFSDVIYLFASTSSTASTYSSRAGIHLKDGEQCIADMSFKPTEAGTYNVWVSTDQSGTNKIGSCKVEVVNNSEAGELAVVGHTIENVGEVNGSWSTVYGSVVKGTATLKNIGKGIFSEIITVYLMRSYDKSFFRGCAYEKMLVTVQPGKEVTLDFYFDEGEPQNYYQVWYTINGTPITDGKIRYFALTPGITTYKVDGSTSSVAAATKYTVPANVVAVDIRGAEVKTIVPNSNPNTLYFLAENETVPSGIAGKNVVKGNTAQKLTLTDGCDFFTPISFHALSAEYSRTPARQTSGTGGWETIVLPFAVDKVMNATDNRQIDWFHSSADSGKDFWLKQYYMQDTDNMKVYFDHVDKFMPNVPYIIAVPSNRWGASHDLTGKKLVFSAEKVDIIADTKLVKASSVYTFEGTFTGRTVPNVFVLNEAGTSFQQTAKATVKPFHAWFASDGTYAQASLAIGDFSLSDDISSPVAADSETVDVYTINGIKVNTLRVSDGQIDLQSLPKGIYVINGRKVVK